MKLLALDLLIQEVYLLENGKKSGDPIWQRLIMLKDAIQQLESLALKSDCISCRYNKSSEELSRLNEEEYLQAFDKCRTCSNYYTNNFEEK